MARGKKRKASSDEANRRDEEEVEAEGEAGCQDHRRNKLTHTHTCLVRETGSRVREVHERQEEGVKCHDLRESEHRISLSLSTSRFPCSGGTASTREGERQGIERDPLLE